MHLTLDLLKKKREAGMGVVLRCPYTTHRTNNEDIKGCTQALARASAPRQCCVLGQQANNWHGQAPPDGVSGPFKATQADL